MLKASLNCVRRGAANMWPLYGAAFAMAISISVLWTAMPFVMRDLGGTEKHVGYIWAANMLGYLLCLLYAASHTGQVRPRTATRWAAAVMFGGTAVMVGVVYYVAGAGQPTSTALVWTMIASGALTGAAMSLFWPFLMTWVSAEHQGLILNRRLGTYNAAWSSAAIIGPLLGGMLVDFSTLGPVVVGAACLGMCFVFLHCARDGCAGGPANSGLSEPAEPCPDRRSLLHFRWTARVALFCSWACLGVSRSQFALLFASMGFSETQFGMLVTLFGIFNFATLTGAGRFGFWHFKPMLLFCVQGFLALSMVLIIVGRTLWAFVPAFAIMGSAFGFAYSSHLYYGACGSGKRSVQMAIHEATISLGIIVGSGAGGILSESLGVYAPYWFGVGVLAVGVAVQVLLWLVLAGGR